MRVENRICISIESNVLKCLLFMVLLFSIIFVLSTLQNVYGIGVYSKSEKPFNTSYDDWAARFWNKWIGKNTADATPKEGGCLLVNNNDNKSEPMVMLMETADVNSPPTQSCQISSHQGI